MFNSNAIHNVINLALAVIGSAAVFDWNLLLSPEAAVAVMGGLGVAKLVINTFRDGLTNLFKPQPPVGS